jgi:hypothetical protein
VGKEGEVTIDRELDVFIAERIMGWKIPPGMQSYGSPTTGRSTEIPRFSMDDAAREMYQSKVEALGATYTITEKRPEDSGKILYSAVCKFAGRKGLGGPHESKSWAVAEAVCDAFGFDRPRQKLAPKAPGE